MICEHCKEDATKVGLVIHDTELWCRPCHYEAVGQVNPAHCVIGDEIDIEIKHGLCHADGTPRRVRSREGLKKLAERKGYTNYVATATTPGRPTNRKVFGMCGHTKGSVQR